MQWKVRLKGDVAGLAELAESFTDDPEIFEEDGAYFLRSSEFEETDDVEQIREVTKGILRSIRQFAPRDSVTVNDLDSETIYAIEQDGSRRLWKYSLFERGLFDRPAQAEVDSEDGSGDVYLPADRTYEWTQLAMEDDQVGELVDLLEQGSNWVNLNRILEFIEANIHDEDNIIEHGWWSEQEKSLFTHTANSRDAIGDESRHGFELDESPSDPMSHTEAARLIETLVDRWLQHRQNAQT